MNWMVTARFVRDGWPQGWAQETAGSHSQRVNGHHASRYQPVLDQGAVAPMGDSS
jgi:hypothetical protein